MTTMNKSITSILALLVLSAAPAMAVPAGINYQGALTDDQGNPVTGTRTMSIKLYDAATDGTLLYSEDMGEVDVSDGVFSFEFGAGGTSNAQESETVAITDGTATSFQKVLSHPVIVVGMGISVTDGTYTWSQSGGSSNEDDFSVVYSTNLRRVTVTYLNGAPAAGRTITATYRTPASGISGALAGDNQPWAEITVDGVAQVPRQKVLTVPFAARAASVESSFLGKATTRVTIPVKQIAVGYNPGGGVYTWGQPTGLLPISVNWYGSSPQDHTPALGRWEIPPYVRRIHSITITFNCGTKYGGTPSTSGTVVLGLLYGSPWPDKTLAATPSPQTVTFPVGLDIPLGETWVLKAEALPSGNVSGTGGRVLAINVEAEVWSVAVP